MKALLFPGQGSQIVGMGRELFNNFTIIKNIFEQADQKLKFKISKIILEGPENELKLTKNTQPAILTVSYAIYKLLTEEFGFNTDKVKFFAGHSLGEYSALVCAECLSFEDALYLLRERGKAMQEAVPAGEGAMLAVLGMNVEEVKKYIFKIVDKKICEIANDNADGQVILSGDIKSINKLQENLKDDKKKCIVLPVSAPFHCSLMKSAAANMREKIMGINFSTPKIEVVTNVTAEVEKSPENIKKLLIEQIYSKVRWRESIIYMQKKNIDEFVEIGPGKVLSGLVKRIVKNSNTKSINSVEDIKKIK